MGYNLAIEYLADYEKVRRAAPRRFVLAPARCSRPAHCPPPPPPAAACAQTWMLDSFRALDARVLAPAGRPLSEWVFLEVSPGLRHSCCGLCGGMRDE